ncbi:MAG: ribosome biogenesis GTPase Der [Planctomycetota bacterium]
MSVEPGPRIPTVAIVGRPNVGKSTLFNAIVGNQVSIVEETPGVTRDRVIRTVTWGARTFNLVDTGGIGVNDVETIMQGIARQVELAIAMADLIMFLVDAGTGPQDAEARIAKDLRRTGKPVLLVANKADSPEKEDRQYDFRKLGFGEPLLVSALGRRGMAGLRDRLAGLLPAVVLAPETGGRPRIAIVGRRNTGKSSLVNALAREERVIVSSIPGTTRDAIDVAISHEGRDFLLIDTAGLQKRGQRKGLDFYGSVRTAHAITRADGVVLLLDAIAGIGQVDQQVAAEIVEQFKPCVIAVNKWDLAGAITTERYMEYIAGHLAGMHFVPVVFMSVHDHRQIWSPLKLIIDLIAQSRIQLPTPRVNAIIHNAAGRLKPPRRVSKEPKVYYAVQTGILPPTFRLYVNDAALFTRNFQRTFANAIRADSEINEVPVKIQFINRTRETREPKGGKRPLQGRRDGVRDRTTKERRHD